MFGRAMGHAGKRGCHIGDIEFGDSRRDEAWGSQIGSGPGGGAVEFVENSIRVIAMAKHGLTELDALSDGSANAIYLGK